MFSDLIFDFGSNHGQNLEYFLSRASKVIAVEANPLLCRSIESRFSEYLASNRLAIENVVLRSDSTFRNESRSVFYINQKNDLISSIEPPSRDRHLYDEVEIPSITPSELVLRYSDKGISPKYVKVDLEGSDAEVLQDLFLNNIHPQYISCESQSMRPVATLLASRLYKGFKFVDSKDVHRLTWNEVDMNPRHFVEHSSGPFGEDVPGHWYSPESFLVYFSIRGPGWFDVHATQTPLVIPKAFPRWILAIEALKRIYHKFSRSFKP